MHIDKKQLTVLATKIGVQLSEDEKDYYHKEINETVKLFATLEDWEVNKAYETAKH